MYLVYISNYGELAYECDNTEIIGLYATEEQAKDKIQELIDLQFQAEENWLLDTECDLDREKYVRLFWDSQENWSCYYEIFIQKVECE